MFRHTRQADPVAARDQDQETRETAAMLVSQAQTHIAAILNNSDSHDSKALGLLAATAASVGLLVSARASMDRYWWATAVGLLAAAVCFMGTLWNREFRVGPDIAAFYGAFWNRPALEASVQMLAELQAAVAANTKVIDRKGRFLSTGYLIIVVTTVGSAVYLPLVH